VRPGDGLLHPIALAATALYVANDWWLKAAHPGILSGKLSDVAGMVVLPLTLVALAELVQGRILSRAGLGLAVAATVVGFSLVELWEPAERLWCWTWGLMQWPFRALAGSTELRPVVAWSDPTDLLTVPFAALAWVAGRGRAAEGNPQAR
jgi:hypothetical protein